MLSSYSLAAKKPQKTETTKKNKTRKSNMNLNYILNALCGSRPATEAKNGKVENRGVALIWLILYFSRC